VHNLKGNIVAEHQGFYMHRRTTSARGGVTAYFEMKKTDTKQWTVSYTLALCNPIDTFSKRMGRQIAKGRFDKDRHGGVLSFHIEADDVKEMRDFAIKRMDMLCRFELNELMGRHDVKIQNHVRAYERALRTRKAPLAQ